MDREASLEIILESAAAPFTRRSQRALAERKNGYYVAEIESFGPQDLFPGVRELLEARAQRGLKLGLASASRNAPALLQQTRHRRQSLRLHRRCRDDRARQTRSGDFPDRRPELGVAPERCIGMEDAAAGIAAIHAAGMAAVGIGDSDALPARRRRAAEHRRIRPGGFRFNADRPTAEPRRNAPRTNLTNKSGENTMQQTTLIRYALSVAIAAALAPAMARPGRGAGSADAPQAGQSDATTLDTVVVTGTARQGVRKHERQLQHRHRLAEQIKQANPESTADLLKISPGIWAEPTGGQTGANIEMRGFLGRRRPFLHPC